MTVAVCGTSVADVWDVLDVLVAPVVDVVDRAVVVEVVVEEALGVELLEQAANARAHAGRTRRLKDRLRKAVGIRALYDGSVPKWGFRLERCVA